MRLRETKAILWLESTVAFSPWMFTSENCPLPTTEPVPTESTYSCLLSHWCIRTLPPCLSVCDNLASTFSRMQQPHISVQLYVIITLSYWVLQLLRLRVQTTRYRCTLFCLPFLWGLSYARTWHFWVVLKPLVMPNLFFFVLLKTVHSSPLKMTCHL